MDRHYSTVVSTVPSSQANYLLAIRNLNDLEQEHNTSWGSTRLETQRNKPVAASQEALASWIRQVRAVDKIATDFWDKYARGIEDAKMNFAKTLAHLQDENPPHIIDMLNMDPWMNDISVWYDALVEKKSKQADERAQADHAAASQDKQVVAAASQDRQVVAATARYRRYFNEAAGRPLDAGPPGVTCEQPPPLDENMGWEDLAAWWLDLGGYDKVNQEDEHGWTPLHHAIDAMVHWDQAYKIAEALIRLMAESQDGARWLRAKTRAGKPPHRTALHMLSCNSDRALMKAVLVKLLAEKVNEIDPRDDKGRTPLMHAVGTGLLDVAKALVAAGADPTKECDAGKNLANRCVASSGMMRRWVQQELRLWPNSGLDSTRYRKAGQISLSRQTRYNAAAEMDLAVSQEFWAWSQGPAAASSGEGGAASSSGTYTTPPPIVARATPLDPSSSRGPKWEWFYDQRRQKWYWDWVE